MFHWRRKKSYGFGTTWEWVNNDWKIIFGTFCRFTSISAIQFYFRCITWDNGKEGIFDHRAGFRHFSVPLLSLSLFSYFSKFFWSFPSTMNHTQTLSVTGVPLWLSLHVIWKINLGMQSLLFSLLKCDHSSLTPFLPLPRICFWWQMAWWFIDYFCFWGLYVLDILGVLLSSVDALNQCHI